LYDARPGQRGDYTQGRRSDGREISMELARSFTHCLQSLLPHGLRKTTSPRIL